MTSAARPDATGGEATNVADDAVITRWPVRWRRFALVNAELWGWRDGHELCVSHSRFAPR